MKNPFDSGCPICHILPRHEHETGNPRCKPPLTLMHTPDSMGRVVVCNHCGTVFVILNEHEKGENDEDS